VMPLAMQHYPLLERNLLYTAVTRGRRLVVVVAQPRALAMAVKTARSAGRVTDLAERLRRALPAAVGAAPAAIRRHSATQPQPKKSNGRPPRMARMDLTGLRCNRYKHATGTKAGRVSPRQVFE
ncbi:MAG: ATP-binding domain-containing protein, partial [Syntrophaceae bacterium]|nr:ATP-binding domain-containing protein [Syntrophaceae bacterium]